MNEYTEYLIEYDTNAGNIWVSGMTKERFWIDLDYIRVWDDPFQQANDLAEQMRGEGLHVDLFDITDEEDEFIEEDMDDET